MKHKKSIKIFNWNYWSESKTEGIIKTFLCWEIDYFFFFFPHTCLDMHLCSLAWEMLLCVVSQSHALISLFLFSLEALQKYTLRGYRYFRNLRRVLVSAPWKTKKGCWITL